MSLWDVPDVLCEVNENWPFICGMLRTPDETGVVDPLDYVLCGDASVRMRLHALSIMFRARKFCVLICL